MPIKNTEIAKILEGVAERLDDVVEIVSILDINEHSGYEAEDYDIYSEDESDQIESTDIIAENRIDEITEILTREIDSIRKLVELIER